MASKIREDVCKAFDNYFCSDGGLIIAFGEMMRHYIQEHDPAHVTDIENNEVCDCYIEASKMISDAWNYMRSCYLGMGDYDLEDAVSLEQTKGHDLSVLVAMGVERRAAELYEDNLQKALTIPRSEYEYVLATAMAEVNAAHGSVPAYMRKIGNMLLEKYSKK